MTHFDFHEQLFLRNDARVKTLFWHLFTRYRTLLYDMREVRYIPNYASVDVLKPILSSSPFSLP